MTITTDRDCNRRKMKICGARIQEKKRRNDNYFAIKPDRNCNRQRVKIGITGTSKVKATVNSSRLVRGDFGSAENKYAL